MWLTLIKPILFAFFHKQLNLLLLIASRYKEFSSFPDETSEEHKDRLRRMAIDEIKKVYPNLRTSHIDILLGFVVATMVK